MASQSVISAFSTMSIQGANLFSLPFEVRFEIYQLLLRETININITSHNISSLREDLNVLLDNTEPRFSTRGPLVPLMQSCSRIRQEIIVTFYPADKKNTAPYPSIPKSLFYFPAAILLGPHRRYAVRYHLNLLPIYDCRHPRDSRRTRRLKKAKNRIVHDLKLKTFSDFAISNVPYDPSLLTPISEGGPEVKRLGTGSRHSKFSNSNTLSNRATFNLRRHGQMVETLVVHIQIQNIRDQSWVTTLGNMLDEFTNPLQSIGSFEVILHMRRIPDYKTADQIARTLYTTADDVAFFAANVKHAWDHFWRYLLWHHPNTPCTCCVRPDLRFKIVQHGGESESESDSASQPSLLEGNLPLYAHTIKWQGQNLWELPQGWGIKSSWYSEFIP